jgi:hypothetical protein
MRFAGDAAAPAGEFEKDGFKSGRASLDSTHAMKLHECAPGAGFQNVVAAIAKYRDSSLRPE